MHYCINGWLNTMAPITTTTVIILYCIACKRVHYFISVINAVAMACFFLLVQNEDQLVC